MLHLTQILGNAAEPKVAERLHSLAHRGTVEYITLNPADTARKRLRISSDHGTDCAIAIPRSQRLRNGSVLLLEESRAVVIRMRETEWLTLAPRDQAAALELGYFCGNLHWRVRFKDSVIMVALDGPKETYTARLVEHLADGRARLVDDNDNL